MLLGAAGIKVDRLVGGDDVERSKPAPDGLLLIADQLGLEVSRLAYIGDSPLDMEAAKAAGYTAWSPAWGHMVDPAVKCDRVLSAPADVLQLVKTD